MEKGMNSVLSESEKEDCDAFRKARIKYRMSQKKWSDAIGISLGLVKAIENYTRRCSDQTKSHVMDYVSSRDGDPDYPDTLSLESHVMADLFLIHMGNIPRKEAADYSKYCAKQMVKILEPADSLTADTQAEYFKFLIQALSVLRTGVSKAALAVRSGENILVPEAGLDKIFKKSLTKEYLSADGEIQVSADGQISVQQDLYDSLIRAKH